MIKVIKKANNNNRITCDYCGCVFEYGREDILHDEGNCYVNCPECEEPCDLDNQKLDDVTYPNGFYSFKKGTDVCDSDINNWV